MMNRNKKGFSKDRVFFIAGTALVLTTAAVNAITPNPWILQSTPSAASVTGGFWTLNQSATPSHTSTLASPRTSMCTSGGLTQHAGTDLMQPYYFPLTFGNDKKMIGYFDYRVKDNEELTSYGTSADHGMTWLIHGNALQLNNGLCGSDTITDNGQGHPAVVKVGHETHLYTLDRATTPSVLLSHIVKPKLTNPLENLPADEPVRGNVIPATAVLVKGLTAPDGILGVMPGFKIKGVDDDAVVVLYLSKQKGFFGAANPAACPSDATSKNILTQLGKKPNEDFAEMHLAHTLDGINFVDDGAVTFDKINPMDPNMAFTSTRFIGPRGTIVRYEDGSYGLFFSGGNCGDGDSDAYHYVGYAHSTDGWNWIVDNDINNPIVGVDYSHLGTADLELHHYTGRVYSPTVTFSKNGKTATLIFSGYNTPQPLPSTKSGALLGVPAANYQPIASQIADYRAIMVATLKRGSAPRPQHENDEMDEDHNDEGHDDMHKKDQGKEE